MKIYVRWFIRLNFLSSLYEARFSELKFIKLTLIALHRSIPSVSEMWSNLEIIAELLKEYPTKFLFSKRKVCTLLLRI